MSLKSLHQHVHFIRQWSEKLRTMLTHAVFNGAYTLSKNELSLHFYTQENTHFNIQIKIDFQTCFVFFDNQEMFKRGNAQPLFTEVNGKIVKDIVHHDYNRSFEMQFNQTQSLVFKMYDGLANVLLMEDGKVSALFREDIQNDWLLTPAEFVRYEPDWKKAIDNFVFKAGSYCIIKNDSDGKLPFVLLMQTTNNGFCTENILEAYHDFSKQNLTVLQFIKRQQDLIHGLNQKINSTQKYILQAQSRLNTIQHDVSPEEIGHIIMANLGVIQKGENNIVLHDFYRDQPLSIRLKKDLSPQDNAAYYYRKSKNRNIEIAQLTKQIDAHQNKLSNYEVNLNRIKQAQDTKALRPFEQVETKTKLNLIPFKAFHVNGFDIWVGKNASNNDLLTLKYAHKNDTWLHAKDVSGSHVVIKHKPGKTIPTDVLKQAAEIAAYYSKLKGSKWVPVIFTFKKYIRKPKGFEPGQVAVDKEEIIMVEPKLPESNS